MQRPDSSNKLKEPGSQGRYRTKRDSTTRELRSFLCYRCAQAIAGVQREQVSRGRTPGREGYSDLNIRNNVVETVCLPSQYSRSDLR